MRFDDLLDTVLADRFDTPFAARAAWRQLVDLVGRGRVPADARTMAMLAELREIVEQPARAAAARALIGSTPPAPLVRLLATDAIEVAAPVLRSATLDDNAWVALLPELTPAARAVLRHRRDLAPAVTDALDGYRSIDFVLPDVTRPTQTAAPRDGFRPLGEVAQAIVSEAEPRIAPPGVPGETYRIADVVARIEAYQRGDERAPSIRRATPAADTFGFETDSLGTMRWTDAEPRTPLIGLSIARGAEIGSSGVDAGAAGAFARRTRLVDARLLLMGEGELSGAWRLTALPRFDGRTGRFTGYRGQARRPRIDEQPGRSPAPQADALRQLVHELRTPTNAIAGFSEMIEHAMLGPVAPPYRAQAATIRRDAGGLIAAIDDLDTAARLAGGALELRPEPIALAPLMAAIADDLRPLADTRGARLALFGSGGTIQGDARTLRRLIERLIATMLAAAGSGETVTATLVGATLTVTRPASFAGLGGAALLALDDESNPASLLGTGFALRLVRNLAVESGGSLAITPDALTLRLPPADSDVAGQARRH